MHTKYEFDTIAKDIVYVKPVAVAELPADLQEHAGDLDTIFAVHNANGEQLALVANRKLAFHLARENDMRPVRVH